MPIPRSSDTPSVADSDDQLEPGPARRALDADDDSDVSRLITETLYSLMNPSGDTAEEAYQRSLDRLRERGDQIAPAVGAKYEAMDEDQYLERWSLVQLLTDLRHPSVVPALTEVLRRPIPPERSPDPAHGISTVGEEVIIRTTAIEALGRLAADGDPAAKAQLLEQVQHRNFSVRRAAIQAITESGDAELIQHVRRELEGTDDERLLQYRRVDVRSVPQAEGGRFLKQGSVPPLPPTPPAR
jgi:HEAT repeat protein